MIYEAVYICVHPTQCKPGTGCVIPYSIFLHKKPDFALSGLHPIANVGKIVGDGDHFGIELLPFEN